MAFDVYVGSFTRYFRHEWQNAAQKMAREQAIEYKTVYANGAPPPPQPAKEIQAAVGSWCATLQQGLGSNISHPIVWNESEDSPYFTDRPGWEGYSAILLIAAYEDHHDLTRPHQLPDKWYEDPAFLASSDTNFRSAYSQIIKAELWLPLEVNFYFEAQTLTSDKQRIGSTFELKRQLQKLQTSLAARNEDNGSNLPESGNATSLREMGKFGLEIFLRLADHACNNRLPMLLDY